MADASSERHTDVWLIWSNEHHAWWGHDSRGYRKNPDDAGRYSFDDAMGICRVRSWVDGVPPETMIHESAVWFSGRRGVGAPPKSTSEPNSPESRIADLERELAAQTADRQRAERELHDVDAVLARRPALDDFPTRYNKIERCIAVAARAEAAESRLAALTKQKDAR